MALKTVYCKVRNRIRIRMIDDERIAALIRKTLRSKPEGRTNWSCRAIAAETRLSKSTVQRVWRAFGIQPHRRKHFKLSTDPLSVEKVGRDLVQSDHTTGHPPGNVHSVEDLVRKIDLFFSQYNTRSRPFVWTATADSILRRLERSRQATLGTRH